MADPDDRGFRALTDKITQARGVRCESYKEKCLRRRIAVRMRARGVHSFDDYARLLDQDAREYELLLDALTINVTKFYRNPETWTALAKPHLTELWRSRHGHVRAWSAGCASGEEPYTLAVLFAETARHGGMGSVRIDATDIDRQSLERCADPAYPEVAFSEMPPELVRRYFSPEVPRRPNPDIRRMVQVASHDLTRQPPPHPPYDLIVCRNVVIYFDRTLQERLFDDFAQALSPGGILVLGKVETLLGPARARLELVDARERLYRQPS